MTNEQATELLALMADQLQATDRLTETFERRFGQLTEVVLNGFVRLEDKFDKKTDLLAEEIRGTNRRVDHLTERVDHLTERVDHLTEQVEQLTERVDHLTDEVRELKADVREVKEDIRDIKTEAQTTNRRLQATFEQTGQLTEANTTKETRLVQLETEVPSNAELHRRVLALEEQARRVS